MNYTYRHSVHAEMGTCGLTRPWLVDSNLVEDR